MKRILIFSLQCVFAVTFYGQPIGELVKKAGDVSAYRNSDQLVIFDSTMVDMQETGLTYVVNHTLTKVLTSHGALDLSVCKYGYDPLSAFVEILLPPGPSTGAPVKK